MKKQRNNRIAKKNVAAISKADLVKKLDLTASASAEKIDTLEDEIQTSLHQLREARIKYRNVTQQVSDYKEKVTSLEEEYDEAREQRDTLQQQLAQLNHQVEQLNDHLLTKDSALSVNTAVTQSIQSEQEHMKMEFLRSRLALHEMRQELARVHGELEEQRVKAAKLKNTLSYQLGHTLIFSTKSWKGFFSLPLKLLALKKTAKERRGITIPPSMLSKPLPDTISVNTRADVIHLERAFEKLVLDTGDGITKALRRLKVASIMDEFTYLSYEPECNLLQLTPQNWLTELESFHPELLMIESAWRGKNDLWGSKVGHMSQEVVSVVEWCRSNGVPTIFWNKEDPVHFETFLNTAKLFDYVFTTDIDCISRYKTALGHDRVYFLPFAAQPKVNNPIEMYQRKDAFCFAGAYYTKYPERTRDLGDFLLSLPSFKPVEIYDRNYGKNDPNYQFPAEYQPFIVGTLPYSEIDKAYKGYYYSINLNSIKQSQSMFARRVFELLASNTITVSNFSRGVRAMFGDLVFTGDSGSELVRRLKSVAGNPLKVKQLRLMALRKVMLEHTYQDRLAYIYSKVSSTSQESMLPAVCVTAYARSIEECVALIQHFTLQEYENKRLVIVTPNGLDTSGLAPGGNVTLLSASDAEQRRLREACGGAWLSAMVAEDYYGPHYLTDIIIATRYTDAQVIGKGALYKVKNGELQLNHGKRIYQELAVLPARSSLAFGSVIPESNLREWVTNLYTYHYENARAFSVDEFNYCINGADEADRFDEFHTPTLAAGYSLAELNQIAENCQPFEGGVDELPALHATTLSELLVPAKNTQVSALMENGLLAFSSSLSDGKHEYWYAKREHHLSELNVQDGKLRLHMETTPGLNLQFVLLFMDINKERISHVIKPANRNVEIDIPQGTMSVKLGLRIYAAGSASLSSLILDFKPQAPCQQLARNPYLVITNNYPSYNDLYKNAFVHSRVKAYKEAGVTCDVFRFKADTALSYHEFEDIDVTTGGAEALEVQLRHGHYKHIVIHFIDRSMWDVIKHHLDRVKITVWTHGADIQSYERRAFLYDTPEQHAKAQALSDARLSLWREMLSPMHMNLKVVFVSRYLAETSMEDLGIRIPPQQYAIIHNPIDTDFFEYKPKPAEQRKKILSIRPYASRVYANDLMVKAILELQQYEFFKELEFRIIGDGPLFDEILAPIVGLDNVIIERRFVNRHEIKALHQQYGLFMCPTRMDTQGVSRDEAMSSGLVPITSYVAAVPEFINKECAIFDGAESIKNMVSGVISLYNDPSLFLNMSNTATKCVRGKSELKMTVRKELDICNISKS
ncbi:glycosyltransferase [Aeromonas sp. sif2416]|uniref:glycosyltransferase family protein n=1 Tax=Aeromonas sp. sif2416 TaxID=2854793 RepID=UPI001C43BF70|nr:glycosyltransferase [Aeromonas sp. sif2416]MBV7436135.1 glycosyltransferase [Aeromonas sp. sif2416]